MCHFLTAVPFQPDPDLAAPVSAVMLAGLVAGGHVAPDPETGQMELTESGEQLVEGTSPRQEVFVPDVVGD